MSVAYDHSGPWTVDDVLALQEDLRGHRYELLDGSLLMSPAPELRHQRASFNLHVALAAAARAAGADVEVFEGVNVRVPSGLLVPDLVVIEGAAVGEDPLYVDADAVLLAVELVSPGNRRMDRTIKPVLYAEAGIPTYWRVEFDPSPYIVVNELDGTRYIETATLLTGKVTTVNAPFPVSLDPAALVRR